MLFPQSKPLVQLVHGNAELFTEPFNGAESCEIFPQEPEDKEQSVAGVRNDAVRKDRVGMTAAVAENPHDAEFLPHGMPISEINDGSAVIVMDMAVSGGTTNGAGLFFWLKLSHVGLEEIF